MRNGNEGREKGRKSINYDILNRYGSTRNHETTKWISSQQPLTTLLLTGKVRSKRTILDVQGTKWKLTVEDGERGEGDKHGLMKGGRGINKGMGRGDNQGNGERGVG